MAAASGGHHQDIANLELSLAPTPAAPGIARSALADWLGADAEDAAMRIDAQLLVTELVSNSIRHAQTEPDQLMRLRAWTRGTALHIEVWDAGTGGTVVAGPPRLADSARTGGFGLNLIALLSTDWGVHRDTRGTTVWLVLPTV